MLPRICTFAVLAIGTPQAPSPYFVIQVVDDATGRGVPLVELSTVHNLRYVTDSNGIVTFHEPGLMDQRVWFHVKSHGYDYPADGFGYHGIGLDVRDGGSAVVPIRRVNIAERLYRVTGGGIYRDSVLAGRPTPLSNPAINGLVLGSDSVLNAVYRGKLYWFWGDTNRPAYPLGNFHVTGATSLLPDRGGLDPQLGVDFTYFVDDTGFAKSMAPLPGEGPTWIDGLVVLQEADGRERMFADYAKVRPNMETYEWGIVEFNDAAERFEKVRTFDLESPIRSGGYPFRATVEDVEYILFTRPFPVIRVRPETEQLLNLGSYEAFTCLQEGSRMDAPRVDRTLDGAVRYGWRKNAPPITPAGQKKLVETGLIRPEEALFHVQDERTGKPVRVHAGSVYWNDFRGRWVMIVHESWGTSLLGEIWYAEADTPLGPWVYARKIVTHDRYSFYNPKQHPMFDEEGGRIIYFEGTYTAMFSGNPDLTPRYEYNQIM